MTKYLYLRTNPQLSKVKAVSAKPEVWKLFHEKHLSSPRRFRIHYTAHKVVETLATSDSFTGFMALECAIISCYQILMSEGKKTPGHAESDGFESIWDHITPIS